MTSDPTALLPRAGGACAAAVVAGTPRGGIVHDVPDPATGDRYDRVGWASPGDAHDAVEAARAAFAGWAGARPRLRARALRAVAADIRDHADALAVLITRETGKRVAEARAEAMFSAEYFDWFADAATTPAGTHLLKDDKRYLVASRPVGVVAAVTPWNFPLSIPARKVAAALAAGCPVVLKPSELAPLSAAALLALIERHTPAGLVNLVNGDGEELIGPLVDHPDIAAITFTGSTRVGTLVARRAMRTMTRVTMELGGTAPFIIDADADVDLALDVLLVAKFRNNGASCIAANNVYIHHDLYDEVLSALAGRISSLRVGAPDDDSTDVGPLLRREHADRLHSLVAEAERRGCRTWRAETPDRGWYFPPTLVAASPRISLWSEEIFGPVCAVRPFRLLDDVVREVNSRGAGLAAYIVSADTERSLTTAARLKAGIVGINNGAPNTPEVPFGGVGLSGTGSEGGLEGMREFLEPQTVALAR
ncbi:aldehyde dehydrogenase family protein [Actinomadura chibensis]|uniref:Aldehyde dehydrogenase family protein n=1 Tax=Actinomadura chibensis TaxID=392828 RepID=A0A5D0NBN3_9ACTN|nr:aldehyde dehydrogenase family protein [Actinomadura chibensis]TYB41864.1 aldehyde dehydrogenase family protein [Actinomadura chibensis]